MLDDEDQDYTEEDRSDDIYSTDDVEELLDGDELMAREEAFMKGYDEERDNAMEGMTCKNCGYQVDIDDKICPLCGSGIRTSSQEA